jgi:hypothetical protein
MVSAMLMKALHRNSFQFKPLSQAKQAMTTDCADAAGRWSRRQRQVANGTARAHDQKAPGQWRHGPLPFIPATKRLPLGSPAMLKLGNAPSSCGPGNLGDPLSLLLFSSPERQSKMD